ncbi:MAG: glycosyltransferase, partial [Anaerolineae bacterium]|nr:glycosyltransferase [Anaerolineae bacterium]
MLSAIIVSWNVRELLRSCLRSLQADLDLAGLADVARIIVVDSASSDGTPAMLHDEFPGVELIASETNIGYVKGNNLALSSFSILSDGSSHRHSQFFWLLNPDTIIHPGATQTLIDFMQAHPRCGLCGPQLRNPDGSLQHGAFELPGLE